MPLWHEIQEICFKKKELILFGVLGSNCFQFTDKNYMVLQQCDDINLCTEICKCCCLDSLVTLGFEG
jgi:hypothetical protein